MKRIEFYLKEIIVEDIRKSFSRDPYYTRLKLWDNYIAIIGFYINQIKYNCYETYR